MSCTHLCEILYVYVYICVCVCVCVCVCQIMHLLKINNQSMLFVASVMHMNIYIANLVQIVFAMVDKN